MATQGGQWSGGCDSAGETYNSANEMWQEELAAGLPQWYKKGIDYWATVPATVDGVLGGYGMVTSADVAASAIFLKKVFTEPLKQAARKERSLVALDCGAGVGRITEQFLLHVFNQVDLLEPLEHFINQAKTTLGRDSPKNPKHVGTATNFFCSPMESFVPEKERYDVIWIQWAIGHLTDDDFVQFFDRCKNGLKPDGIIILKENNCESGFVVDKDDSSITRSDAYFRELFDKCQVEVIASEKQKGFPKELFAVRMYAMRPKVGSM
eukprot:CAMPEP_0114285158 /NCGR_PEP_ID=MMETSP0059-20121206/5032_1 /TAXON_ID=36894 /ORGANISM="Pyramimonas parkeae, Strain CCMP726" /LENGTH=265 /DNA_ID=CAMNT_0001406027 /DNA_START=36 /DNA_END=833 /DNA_ORIENTATION=+